jgi:hypothetical protein
MTLVRFPGGGEAPEAGIAGPGEAIDAALNGERPGLEAEALRELRADVRALSSPADPEFERQLQARVAEWSTRRDAPRPSVNERLARLRRRIARSPGRSLAIGGAGVTAAAFVSVFVLVGPLGSGGGSEIAMKSMPRATSVHVAAPALGHAATPDSAASSGAGATVQTRAAEALGTATGRLQQLGASVSLATSPGRVQEAADSVTRVAAGDGGYVERSHVQVRSGGPSEATLTLSLPSGKLAAAIAALGRIAPVRAVSQESQDITGAYESARRRLADTEAVRRALLRALAAATTQGRIDSLREQLASNRSTLGELRAAVSAESHRAADSQLEVTITGGGAAGGEAHEGLTLGHGLHDAGHVLEAVGAVLLIALAVLVPLGLLVVMLDWLRRGWRRRRREAALES